MTTCLAAAAEFSGIDEKSKLINFVLDAYVKKMASRRLAALGRTMPDFDIAPRDSRVGGVLVWTLDRRLKAIPEEMGVSFAGG